jgi:hypothetical protein
LNTLETIRVSTPLKRVLDDPSSLPEGHPHCLWCHAPKVFERRNRRCEICGNYGTKRGKPKITPRVWIEEFSEPPSPTRVVNRTVRRSRRRGPLVASSKVLAPTDGSLPKQRKSVGGKNANR